MFFIFSIVFSFSFNSNTILKKRQVFLQKYGILIVLSFKERENYEKDYSNTFYSWLLLPLHYHVMGIIKKLLESDIINQ